MKSRTSHHEICKHAFLYTFVFVGVPLFAHASDSTPIPTSASPSRSDNADFSVRRLRFRRGRRPDVRRALDGDASERPESCHARRARGHRRAARVSECAQWHACMRLRVAHTPLRYMSRQSCLQEEKIINFHHARMLSEEQAQVGAANVAFVVCCHLGVSCKLAGATTLWDCVSFVRTPSVDDGSHSIPPDATVTQYTP